MHKIYGNSIGKGQRIDKGVEDLINKIKEKYKPEQVILFGSFARGDYHAGSDIDLIIVGDFKERFFDRIGKVLELNSSRFDLDALVYTPEEFQRMLDEERPLIMDALRDGIAI